MTKAAQDAGSHLDKRSVPAQIKTVWRDGTQNWLFLKGQKGTGAVISIEAHASDSSHHSLFVCLSAVLAFAGVREIEPVRRATRAHGGGHAQTRGFAMPQAGCCVKTVQTLLVLAAGVLLRRALRFLHQMVEHAGHLRHKPLQDATPPA